MVGQLSARHSRWETQIGDADSGLETVTADGVQGPARLHRRQIPITLATTRLPGPREREVCVFVHVCVCVCVDGTPNQA